MLLTLEMDIEALSNMIVIVKSKVLVKCNVAEPVNCEDLRQDMDDAVVIDTEVNTSLQTQ